MKLAYLAWIVVCLVWGTTYLGIRIALETFPVALLAGVRWAVAGGLLMALLPVLGERLPPLRAWGPIAMTGFLMAVLGNGGVVWAQQYVASGLAAVLIATVPFWSIAVEACLPNSESVSRRAVSGLLIGFLGVAVLVWPEVTVGGDDARMFVYGVISLQIATLGWALGQSYTKRNTTAYSPFGTAAVQMLLSGLMLLAIGTALGEWSRLTFTARSVGAMVYLVTIGSVVGFSAYVYALRHLPIATVSLYAYINPIIAVLLGTLVLGEPFTTRTVVASALVLAGVGVANTRPRASRSASALNPGRDRAPARPLDEAQEVDIRRKTA